MSGLSRKDSFERRPHYTEFSYGLYKSAHHILALTRTDVVPPPGRRVRGPFRADAPEDSP